MDEGKNTHGQAVRGVLVAVSFDGREQHKQA